MRARNASHEQKRQAFYETVPAFWHDLFGEPYALYDVYSITEEEAAAIRTATDRIAAIYDKTAPLLRSLPDETLTELGIPAESIPYIKTKPLTQEGVIRRVDLVKTPDGWKHFEINADTPTFIYELFHVNGLAARHFGYKDPNAGSELALQTAIRRAVRELWNSRQAPKVVFTAHSDHEEDWNTALYLGRTFGYPHETIPLDQLQLIEEEGLFTPDGEKIDILYRQTYPIEHLINDKSEDGTAIGIELLKLVKDEKLAVINPLSSFLLQSKAVQALIWGLHESNHAFFNETEHEWIRDHYLPTYLENEPFLKKGVKYVEKPAFGREGDTITVFGPDGQPLEANKLKTYDDSLKVYQQHQDLPAAAIQTPFGKETARLLIGSFVIGQKAEAFGIRAGSAITGNEACFLPAGIKPIKKGADQ
ncbi:glutathionylspermidine synthase family protein [Metabacillus sp. 113a]|uniref:glutathionylspermidine synthase family protein n=1 Tax=Metabacillus sp. 113a TaxID=3404706 RepID=UPI003CF0152F